MTGQSAPSALTAFTSGDFASTCKVEKSPKRQIPTMRMIAIVRVLCSLERVFMSESGGWINARRGN